MQAHEAQVEKCNEEGNLLMKRVNNAHLLRAQLDDFRDKWAKTYKKIGQFQFSINYTTQPCTVYLYINNEAS